MLPDPAERPLLSVDEARAALGRIVARSSFYAAVERGEVPGVVRVGRRIFLATAALRTWVGLDESVSHDRIRPVAPAPVAANGRDRGP